MGPPGGYPPFRCKNPLGSPRPDLLGPLIPSRLGALNASLPHCLKATMVPEVRSGGSSGGISSSAWQGPSKDTSDPA